MKRQTLSLLFCLSLVSGLWAAPNITGVSGQIQNGQTVTISGSGFGSKSTAAPLIWDDVESGSFHSDWSATYDLSTNNSNQRHSYSSKNGHLNFRSGNTDGRFTAGNAVHQKWFVQYWFKLSNNWDWGTSTYGGGNQFLSNIKIFRMWNPGSTNENFVVAINGWANDVQWVMENVAGDPNGYFMSNMSSKMSKGSWHLLQFEYSDNTSVGASNGEFRAWLDGELLINKTDILTREDFGGYKRPFIVGFAEVWGAGGESDDAPNDFYIDDIYMDNSWARVEIGDAATYASCTHREIQVPSSWSGSSIQVAVKPGSFSNGASAYLYVVHPDGSVNSSGFPITIGSAPSNNAPSVNAGSNATITLPSSANLDGTVSDDGNPNPPGTVTTTWSKISGPGSVTFGNASAVDTTASFSSAGTYVLRLTADDGALSDNDNVTLTVNPVDPSNDPPVVNAGSDATLTLPATANLDGTASDDGNPSPPGTMTTTWSKVSGPGNVTFGNAAAVDTTASFSEAGSYVLQLLANDSALNSTDQITITVHPENSAPTVNAGADATLTLPETLALNGTVSDDGYPTTPGSVTVVWSRLSGPGTVAFTNATAVDTTAAFSEGGSYVLRLTADDGALTGQDEVTVTVAAPAQSNPTPPANEAKQNVARPKTGQMALIPYELQEAAHVQFTLYDRKGKKIRDLENTFRNAGTYSVQWNGTDASGAVASSGVYYLYKKIGGSVTKEKIVVIK